MSHLPPALPPLCSRQRKGDLAETTFVTRVLRMGFNISKPVTTNCRYDYILDASGKFTRIQIKSLWTLRTNGEYKIFLFGDDHKRPYLASEIDFLAGYIAPCDAWYIIPVAALGLRKTIRVAPGMDATRAMFEKYREAWHLLLPRGVKIGDLKAMADPAAEDIDPSVRAPSPSPRLGVGRAPSG